MLPLQTGTVGVPVTLSGYADDYDRAIRAIEFSLDGEHWTAYETAGATSDKLLHWTFSYVFDEPGTYLMRVRSVNDRGERSPLCDSVTIEIGA